MATDPGAWCRGPRQRTLCGCRPRRRRVEGATGGFFFICMPTAGGYHPSFSVSKIGETQSDGGVPERAALPPRHSSATSPEISVMPSARSAHSRISWNLRVLLYEFLWSYFMESACLAVQITLVFRQRSQGE